MYIQIFPLIFLIFFLFCFIIPYNYPIFHVYIHTYIYTHIYLYTYSGTINIVQEYMSRGSLQSIIDSKIIPSTDDIAITAYSVAMALRILHDDLDIIHRDIKPSNVLVNRYGHVKMADFGIMSEISLSTTFTGTLLYMSPERIKGEPYTKSSDIW